MSAQPFPDVSKPGPVTVSCQCQKIKITIPSLPESANQCQCSLCFKYGVAWGYFHPDEVSIQRTSDEEDIQYTWKGEHAAFGHCASCGTTLYWKATEKGAAARAAKGAAPKMAVNMKLLGPEILKTIKQEYGYE